ncbi:hypothetical protein APY04_0731 [Hyphomicrobium sulfonivorans]|uniref:Uncharacterized protein n=1 Tax=Hyphomicrobium sulfonivorans TaxID=121290 RepID=A0A120CXJ8_HYPSL|nr:hypothetical protein APY04_0731 [Hyphomicrobium sulfonivorans]
MMMRADTDRGTTAHMHAANKKAAALRLLPARDGGREE